MKVVCQTYHVTITQEFQRELGQWRREPGVGKKKPKYSYKTAEELKARGKVAGKSLSTAAAELAQVKVCISMCSHSTVNVCAQVFFFNLKGIS